MKNPALLLLLLFLLVSGGCSEDAENPLNPLAAVSNSINANLPRIALPDYLLTNQDSVPRVVRNHRQEIESIYTVINQEFVAPPGAVQTTTPVPITYSEGRRAEAVYLVYYWEENENTLARQISTDSTAYFLDLYRRTPLDLGAYLPILLAEFSLDYQQATIELHSASAIGDKVVSTTVYASLTYSRNPDLAAWDLSFDQQSTQSTLRLLDDGSGSLNQTHKDKTLFAEWLANGQGSYFLYDEWGQEIGSGSW